MAARLSDKALVQKLLAEVRGLRQRVEEQDELIVAQRQRVAEQDELIAAQQRRIADLESDLAKARKNSSTSSKPPSSDIVTAPGDPKTSKKQGKRTKGAQPGHPKHEREPFAPEAVDETHDHRLEFCPDCGTGLLEAAQPPRVVQQVEIVRVPIRIDEHRGHPAFCPNCQKIHYAPLPAQVEHGQLAGPRLTALVAYLKGMCHASFSTIRKFLRDVVGVTLSRGYLRKLVEKVSDRLAGSYAELLRLLGGRAHAERRRDRPQGERGEVLDLVLPRSALHAV